jgi:flagellar basal body-associated protein FliL
MAEKQEPQKSPPPSAKPDKKDAAEASKPAAAAAAPAKSGGIGGLLVKTPVLLGAVMVVEAVVLFAGFKFLGGSGPRAVAGAELAMEEHKPGEPESAATATKKTVELAVVEFRAPNKQSGHTFLYDVKIVAVVKSEVSDRVKDTLKDSESLVEDRIRTIIAQLDPEKLGGGSEPGLETLRRQVKYQLDEIVGDGMIDSVLVPRCIPFRTDF